MCIVRTRPTHSITDSLAVSLAAWMAAVQSSAAILGMATRRMCSARSLFSFIVSSTCLTSTCATSVRQLS
uniref:Uncharacterized protein n=1 Tax=Ixodes ricinus TaxID=34613 RepID=A0A6B0TTK0_IXORI